jgi:hypothetical protein
MVVSCWGGWMDVGMVVSVLVWLLVCVGMVVSVFG